MPRRPLGSDEDFNLLRLALLEQAQMTPGRVPSGIAQNAYAASIPRTFEQEREARSLEEADARYFRTREAERQRQDELADLRASATARQFQTRRNVREVGGGEFGRVSPTTATRGGGPISADMEAFLARNIPGWRTMPEAQRNLARYGEPTAPSGPAPFTPENFRPVTSRETLPTRKIQRIATTDVATADTPRKIRRFTDVGGSFTDPDAALGIEAHARLDPRVLAAQASGRNIRRVQTVNAKGEAVTQFRDLDGNVLDEVTAAPTAEQRNRSAATGRAAPVISGVTELSEKINTKHGPLARVEGGFRKLKALANEDDDVAEYLALIEGATPLLARALGHTGVLTEQDVERTMKILPGPGDSQSLRDRKIARLDQIIGAQGGAQTPTSTGEGQVFDFVPGRGLVPATR